LKARKEYSLPMGRLRKLWMMDRKAWQRALAEDASAQGVAISENTKVSPQRLREMQKEYDWVIDASGAPSVTSRAYSFSRQYFKEYLLAYQVVLAADFSHLLPRIKFGFFADLSVGLQPAYYWIFPRDAHHANVGLVCTFHGTEAKDKTDLRMLLADVLKDEGLTEAHVVEKGGGIACSRILPKLVYDNILLVGDAAGLTSALHGGGIDMACLSGILAVAAVYGGESGVAAYSKHLNDSLREKIAFEDLCISKMRTLSFDQFDRLLRDVTSTSNISRAKAALQHADMLYATYKWLRKKQPFPAWSDPG